MRLMLLCLSALVAFAANSVLNRAAMSLDVIGPASFQAIRLASGALMLGVLAAWRTPADLMRRPRILGPLSLLLYMVCFSYAYISLDTGMGALILFAGVQLTMFLGAIALGERPGVWRWGGSALGLVGLAILLLPGAASPSMPGALLMIGAAVGWGVYSLLGKQAKAPLAMSAQNFLLAAPLGGLVWLLAPIEASPTALGTLLAVLSGGVASALGYAIWYSVLPQIDASLAAVAQLSVPVIALFGGMIFLGEPVTLTFFIAAAFITCGVIAAVRAPGK